MTRFGNRTALMLLQVTLTLTVGVINSKRLYIRGLHRDVSEGELYNFLSHYGRITEVKVLSNYAFVQFQSELEASLILETYQRIPLLGNKVVVEYSHPLRKDMRSFSSSNTDNEQSAPYRKLDRYPVIVTGIPPGVGWQELKDFGRLSGRMVAFCDIDRSQQGCGFIEYFSSKDALRAARSLDGRYLGGKIVRVIEHEAIRNVPHGRLPSSRMTERRSQYRNNTTRYDNAENVKQTWPPYRSMRMPERQESDRIWHSCGAPGPSQRISRRPSPTIFCDDIAESDHEKVANWTSKCGSQLYTPNSFYNGEYHEYRHAAHAYDFA